MKVTCAVAVYDREGRVLIGHATNQTIWSLPKGVAEPGEDHKTAALRELYEETNLDFRSPNKITSSMSFTDRGEFDYIKNKRLHLFVLELKNQIFIPADLHCNSTFEWNGQDLPELDAFVWVDENAIKHLLFHKQLEILGKAGLL